LPAIARHISFSRGRGEGTRETFPFARASWAYIVTFKPSVWYPIALAATVINLVGIGYAAQSAEPVHAAIHGVLAVAFALWARRLRLAASPGSSGQSELPDRLEALDVEVTRLRQELTETQERLDFAERLLAQSREKPRVNPQRPE
jgi:hypothetical protein